MKNKEPKKHKASDIILGLIFAIGFGIFIYYCITLIDTTA